MRAASRSAGGLGGGTGLGAGAGVGLRSGGIGGIGGMGCAARRLALALAGEGVQSAFHFGVNVALARRLAPADYGVFAVVMVVGAIALTYVRALLGLPATLLVAERSSGPISSGPGSPRRARAAAAVEAAFGSAALMLCGCIGVGAALLFDLWLRPSATPPASAAMPPAAGLFVALWSLRSYLRAVLLAGLRPGAALASDLAFAGAGAALAAAATAVGAALLPIDPLVTAFLVLAGANLAGIAAALAGRRARPRVTLRRSARARVGALGRQLGWSAAATTTANAQATGQVLLVAALGGPEIYAPMAAALALFAPVRLLVAGLTGVILPALAARMAAGRTSGPAPGHASGLGRPLALWTAGALATGLAYGAAAAAALPLMGPTVFAGQPAGLVFALAWATTTAFFLSLVPRLLLEVRRRFRAAAAIGSAGAGLGMAVVVLVLWAGHPAWALSGNLAAECVVLAGSWAAALPAGRYSFGPSSPRVA